MSDPNEKQQDDQTEGNTGNEGGTESTDPGPVPGEDAGDGK